MKKMFVCLFVMMGMSFSTYAQDSWGDDVTQIKSVQTWKSLWDDFQKKIQVILSQTCPKNVSLATYRKQLVYGEAKLSDEDVKALEEAAQPILEYAKDRRELLPSDRDYFDQPEALLVLAALPPMDPNTNYAAKGITFDEVGACIKSSIGYGVVSVSSFYNFYQQGARALANAIIKTATRALGWLGVALTAADLMECLGKAYAD